MRRTAAFRSVALATLVLFSTSCVSTRLPPISSQGRSFEPLRDERALWEESRAEEGKLLEEVRLYQDSRLDAYLERVVSRLNPPAMAANGQVLYKVRVIEDPTLNAFAYPHGSIYVHTGLLARMEDEDELATVLGHEMTHVENRHLLRYQRSAHNKEIGLAIAGVAAAVIVAVAEGDALDHGQWGKAEAIDFFGNLLVGLGLQLAFVASVEGYGRGLEAEADDGGFTKMAAAGYDLRQAPKVYEALLDDQGEPQKGVAFFFSSHPRLSERVAASKAYLAGHPGSPERVAGRDDDFVRALQPVVREDARMNLDMGRLKVAEAEIAKARAWNPEDPRVHFLKGRLRLAQAGAEKELEAGGRLRDEAENAFRSAIELDAKYPEPRRELGRLLDARKDYRGACAQFRRYLDLDPEADDLDTVLDRVAELERFGGCA
jgi:predicted Zn-dependent protease